MIAPRGWCSPSHRANRRIAVPLGLCRMNGFIDIHCHILPGLDDGPRSKEEAEEMLALARDDGISHIVATPHMLNGVCNNTREGIAKAIAELNGAARGISIYMGAEVRVGMEFKRLVENGALPLINDKNFLLLELPPHVIPPVDVLEHIVNDLKIKKIIPIFSHPERNVPIVRDLSIMKRLVRCGALFQVTATSIMNGGNTAKVTLSMMGKDYVQVVASDAHDSQRRPPLLSRCYEYVSKKIGRDLANSLFIENPLKIIHGEHFG
jgi:protein-tyrosine phosphatase